MKFVLEKLMTIYLHHTAYFHFFKFRVNYFLENFQIAGWSKDVCIICRIVWIDLTLLHESTSSYIRHEEGKFSLKNKLSLISSKFTVVYYETVNFIGYIIVFYLLIVNSYASVDIAHHFWTWCNIIKQFFSTCYLTFFPFHAIQVIWWRNEKARPKNFNAVSHNHVRS